MEGDQALILKGPARAAAYLLMATAQRRRGKDKDFSQELLENLSKHPDEVTAGLSDWALNFRFSPDGDVRPLLDAGSPPWALAREAVGLLRVVNSATSDRKDPGHGAHGNQDRREHQGEDHDVLPAAAA